MSADEEIEVLKKDLSWQLTFEDLDWDHFIDTAERAKLLRMNQSDKADARIRELRWQRGFRAGLAERPPCESWGTYLTGYRHGKQHAEPGSRWNMDCCKALLPPYTEQS